MTGRARAVAGYRGRALARQAPGPALTAGRSSRDRSDHAERWAPGPGCVPAAAALATAVRTTSTAAVSAGVGFPATMLRAGGPAGAGSVMRLAFRLSDAEAELAVHARPERVAQPLPGLLVGPEREPQVLLGLDQQFLVDDRGQDGAGEQVPDVVLAAGQYPLLGDVLAGLLDPLPVRAEARGGQVGDHRRQRRGRPDRRLRKMALTEHLSG